MTVKINLRYKMKDHARTALLSVLAVSVIAAGTVFFAAHAEEPVSPSDVVVAENEIAPDDGALPESEATNSEPGGAENQKAEIGDRQSDREALLEGELTVPDIMTAEGIGEIETIRRRFIANAVYGSCFGDELNENERKLYDGLVKTYVTNQLNDSCTVAFNESFTFDVSAYNEETKQWERDDYLDSVNDLMLCAIAAFTFDHPEAYWVRGFSGSCSYDIRNQVGYLKELKIVPSAVYADDYNQRATVQSGIQAAFKSIDAARETSLRYDTVKAIHDYICRNAGYHYAAANSSDSYRYGAAYTAAPLFGGGQDGKYFVCEGYSKAMKILCGKFGIPCVLVAGTGVVSSSSSGPHMWNYVQMEDGNWYGLDATWDDQSQIDYSYFLVGSNTAVFNGQTFSQDHICSGYVMTTKTQQPMVYPRLGSEKYTPPVGDPSKITFTTLGASIRLSDPYGIRFGIQIQKDENYKAANIVEYGTLIIGSGTLGDQELTLETDHIRKIRAENVYSEDSSQLTYTGVLVNIPESFFGTNVKGRGYLRYKDADGQVHTIYSETKEKSFFGVAEAAQKQYEKYTNPTAAQQAVLEKLNQILSKKTQ